MISDNMLLLHGNNRYHVKEHEYQGTDIVAENTYKANLGLKVFGKSTQNGVPSPESPIPINSIGDSGSVDVVVTGKNLIPTNLAQNGISYNADTKRWEFEALSKYGRVNVRIIDPKKVVTYCWLVSIHLQLLITKICYMLVLAMSKTKTTGKHL